MVAKLGHLGESLTHGRPLNVSLKDGSVEDEVAVKSLKQFMGVSGRWLSVVTHTRNFIVHLLYARCTCWVLA